MSSTSSRSGWIASVALLWAASAHAVAPPPGNGLPFDPCRQGALLQWSGVQLLSSAGTADRDGLLFQATLGVGSAGVGTGGLPPAGTISIEVADATGTIAAGTVALMTSYMSPAFAWQPATPLAANAQYTVKVVLANNAPPQCADPPDVTQTFAITTIAELTPAPPDAPLRAIAYGQAWTALGGDPRCCEPRDTAACGGAETCAKCWSARREPTIVPVWDGQSMKSANDPVEYALYYGKLTAIDPNTATGFGFGTALPELAFRPASFPNVTFSESQSEVCMTAATRNVRTGAVTLLPRCTPVTHDGSGLRGIALPDGVTLDAPADSTLTIGPAGCLEPLEPYQREEIQVAASFHTSGDTCWPGCGEIFPRVPVQPAATGSGGSSAPIGVAGASMQPSEPKHWDDGLRGAHNDTGGCQVGAGAAAPNALWIALALALVRRLRRSERGSRPQKFTRGVPG